jgi:hypothetical protein
MTKNETVDLLKSQLPGFYSAEQVINLIEKIEEEQVKPKLSVTQVREIAQSIVDAIEEEATCGNNIVCFDDVEFELDYQRRIEVTDVPINYDVIRDCVENSLTLTFDELQEEDDIVELERGEE